MRSYGGLIEGTINLIGFNPHITIFDVLLRMVSRIILNVFIHTIIHKITMELTKNSKLAHYLTYIPGILIVIFYKPKSFFVPEDPLKI